MPAENLEEEGLPKNPNFEYAQWRFLLGTSKYKNDEDLRRRLLEAIESNSKK